MRSALVVLCLLPSSLLADEGPLVASLDSLQFTAPKEKATVALVDGKAGKANQFTFEAKARSIFCTSAIRGTPAWNDAAGLSFWVKGDGSDAFGGLQFIYDNDFAVRYDVAFPIRNKEWTKVAIAWSDLVPIIGGPKSLPLGPGGNSPSKLSALWVGKWWYWGDYPACSFALDEIRLEPKIDRDTSDHRPTGAPLERVLAKLKAKDPITIVTMGDSLTDTKHWSNRPTNWPAMLKKEIKDRYGVDPTIVNPAIGGTQLRQNLALIPVWQAKAPAPDLVTINFGGNDWGAGMRGPEFHRVWLEAIDRVRRATRGKSEVLVMTTLPNAKDWGTMEELADSGRKAAKEKNAGLADTMKAFHDAGESDRERLFAKDPVRHQTDVHLGLEGQRVVAETVLRAIESAGK